MPRTRLVEPTDIPAGNAVDRVSKAREKEAKKGKTPKDKYGALAEKRAKKGQFTLPKEESAQGLVRDPETLERILRTFTLRKGGAPYAAIASNLGITEEEARDNVREATKMHAGELQEGVDEHIAMQLERLNDLLLAQWPKKGDTRVVGTILNIMARQDVLKNIATARTEVILKQDEYASLPTAELEAFLERRAQFARKPKPIDYNAKGSAEEGDDE